MPAAGPGGGEPGRRQRRALRALRPLALALSVVTGLLGALTVYAELTLPSLDGLGRATGTLTILDRHGARIAEIGHDDRPRQSVRLGEVSPLLVEATLATEDRDFYQEGAVNPTRILRALLVDSLSGSAAQGGSTITQQLAKLAFLTPDHSPLRKLREALLADRIDQRYGKDEILEKYLNLVDYGAGAVGVEAAAQRYFGVDARDLDLRQASLLAGLPNAPALDSPFADLERAFARQHVVLAAMVAHGRLAPEAAAAIDPLPAGDPADPAVAQARRDHRAAVVADLDRGRLPGGGLAPHAVEAVRSELERLFGGQPQLEAGSLSVTTTLDLGVQGRAQQAVHDGVASLGGGADNGALVMLDARSGDVLAMVGSADPADPSINGQFNVATGQRRPGSTFKPIVYAQAFASGLLTPTSTVDDTAAESARLGGVQDADGRFLGRISVARALVDSRNVPAMETMARAGTGSVIDLAHRLGIGSDLAPDLVTAIGGSAVRMTDLATAYTALADGGSPHPARLVLRVADTQGRVLYAAPPRPAAAQVLDAGVTRELGAILRVQPRATGVPLSGDVAGKSGTTDSDVDAWYVAYTPDWVVAAWAGNTAQPGEVGMTGIDGVDVGRAISVPLVASLPSWSAFGYPAMDLCTGGDVVPPGGCRHEGHRGGPADQGSGGGGNG